MALTIEDGTVIANADSFVTLVEARAYGVSRGFTLSAVDATLEGQLRNAADYLGTLESRFKGSRLSVEQALVWPREFVYVYGFQVPLDSDEIPTAIKNAQIQLAYDFSQSDLLPLGDGQEVLREKVDVIETQYAEKGTGVVMPIPTKALAMLQPFFINGGSQMIATRI